MFANLRISTRLLGLTVLTVVLTVVVASLGINGMGVMEARMKSIYEDRVICLGQLANIQNAFQRIRTRLMWAVDAPSDAQRQAHLGKIAEYDSLINKEWKDYTATNLVPEEKILADRFSAGLAATRADRAMAMAAIQGGDLAGAKAMTSPDHKIAKRFVAATDILSSLEQLQIRVGKMDFNAAEETYAATRTFSVAVSVVGLVGALVMTLLIIRSITVPVAASIAVMERLAKDDTSVEVGGQDRKDEVGDIARSVQVFKQNALDKKRLEAEAAAAKHRAEEQNRANMNRMAGEFETSVGQVVDSVASASGDMEQTAQTMSALAGQVAAQATAVAAASDQAAANVQTVAAAAEELSSSVGEIGRQVSESAQVARSAVEETAHTDAIVRGLAEAAGRIGQVISLINDIASQTNLLALNATIEAARAGEAGKAGKAGEAGEAGEVKNLANQTARATDEIAQQINSVQTETGRAVEAIRNVSATIGRIDEISSAIASAVEEQSAATQEIARNVEEAARGTQEVSSNISGVTNAAGETGQASATVLDAARALSAQSGTLRRTVGDFVAKVRAA
ncbi:methyl-accepting chemotaxis protein [Paramagnetospirillum kuznetsovii]|uniref:Methyl-accepting chemotaxis protein n=1 Tax=Paramagnetospirillum kuznetsovii TaxID=2053833 RepID=A0A364P2Y2_9PROT|nr:MCP four helix bundle domain-containing protein [Paramagnetospirillum kuznetsovii]RAU23630.1 methyl-accepting chemotaxis protein [Paramagnetospirillum kuznetsovii]